MNWNDSAELLGDFVLESREHLAVVEAQLLVIECDPHNSEAINSVFRGFHTIKALAGFLGFPYMQELSHEVEGILDGARTSRLTMNPVVIDVVLQTVDYLRRWLAHVEAGQTNTLSIAPQRDEALVSRVRELASPETACANDVQRGGERRYDSGRRRDGAAVRIETNKLDALAMRSAAIGPLFQRMARLVRDLSRQSGKRVELETQGDDTELGRAMLEALADPLMHMVRNAIDHGIEASGEREVKGKHPVARLVLKAQAGEREVLIEVADDGRGLHRGRIAAKAMELGLITSDQGMSDAEVFSLIFEPGVTTAAKVTNISGRGVGMDVVRRQVEKLHGRVEIHSTPGGGTRFLLKLPLRLDQSAKTR